MASQIRAATPADVPVIDSLLREAEAWLRGRGIPMWQPAELLVDQMARDVASGMYFIAEVDGVVAGTIRFQLEDTEFWPDLPGDDSAFVHRLAVRRAYAGTGVGGELLAWAADRARALGRRYLRLDCDASRPRLRAFYERQGFRHHSDRQVGPFYVARYERSTQPPP
jgi:GNAT superfamily N-acetyltransferase